MYRLDTELSYLSRQELAKDLKKSTAHAYGNNYHEFWGKFGLV
jgi:hypothetical protein